MKALLLIIVAVMLVGCADTLTKNPGTVEIQAPPGKCWSGSIGDSSKDGCGTKSYEVKDESIIVAVIQKNTPGRWRMHVSLVMDGKPKDQAETTARFGVAQVSEG